MTQEMDDGQLEAGYNDDETPAEMPEPVVEVAAREPEIVDPMKALMDRFDKLESRTRNAEGHIGGLNHQQKVLSESVQAAAKAASHQVNDAPTQSQVKEAINDPAEWSTLKEDFPEWATATEKYMDAKLSAIKPAFDAASIEQMVNERLASQADSVQKTISYATLDATFPGWQVEKESPAFKAWQSAQPADVQELGNSWDIADAARMLRLYEQSKKAPEVKRDTSTRQKRFEAAVNPRGSGGHGGSTRTDYDDMEAGYAG